MSDRRNVTYTRSGIGLGGLLAVILSWVVNHSVVFCILHFICGWFYVIYWCIEYSSRYAHQLP